MQGTTSICETPVALTKLYNQCFGNETGQQCRLFYTHQCWLTYKNNSATLGHSFTYSCSLIQPKRSITQWRWCRVCPTEALRIFRLLDMLPCLCSSLYIPGVLGGLGTRLQPNSSCLLMKAAQWCMQQRFFFFLSKLPPWCSACFHSFRTRKHAGYWPSQLSR